MAPRTRVVALTEPSTDWSPAPSHAPVAGIQATATQAAAGPGLHNVLTGFVVTLTGGNSAPNATSVTFAVLDGPSGSVNYLWGPCRLSVAAVAGQLGGVARCGLWIRGSKNTPMTIEFSAGAGANTFESVVMEGTTENG